MPDPLELQPEGRGFGQPDVLRKSIFDNVLKATNEFKPIVGPRYTLSLHNAAYADPETVSKNDEKQALLSGGTLARRLRGTWRLSDTVTGQPVDEKHMTIGHVPYLTQYGTFIMGGNDYTLNHQMRLSPGIFTRVKESGELESHVNVARGHSHRYFLDPETGIFRIQLQQARIPLVTVLKALGATDTQLRESWGNELYSINAQKDSPAILKKIYKKLKGDTPIPEGATAEQGIREVFDHMVLDPVVTQHTLGQPFSKVDVNTILATTKKLLDVYHGDAKPDDRDAMAFQRVVGPEDLFAERITKAQGVARKLLWKAAVSGSLQRAQPGTFTKAIRAALLESGLGTCNEDVNPAEILDQQHRITRMGEGGISSSDSVPDDARMVHPSQMGFIDGVHTPDSGNAGVDTRVSINTIKGKDGLLYSKFFDAKTGKTVWKSPRDIADSVVAFAGEMASGNEYVRALDNGKEQLVPRKAVDYELTHHTDSFAPLSNLVRLKSATFPDRMSMGCRFLAQALPLVDPEAPLVQAGMPGLDKSFEELYGEKMGAVRSQVAGTVVAVQPDSVQIRGADKKVHTVELYNNRPNNRKTLVHNTASVRVGQQVNPGDLLAYSNFTDANGTTALGKNIRVAYVPMQGKNYEDASIISESMAQKMKSEHMYQHDLDYEEGAKPSKSDFISIFPGKYEKKLLDNYDADGVIKSGTVVNADEPLILAVKELAVGPRIGRQKRSWSDASVSWEHHAPGVVTDIHKGPHGINVVVKSVIPSQSGDKFSGVWGDKGIALIVPDAQMPVDKDGKPFEMLLNPLGIISRGNPAQYIEAALGKVATKTGKPYKIVDFDKIKDLRAFTEAELKNNGLTSTEDIVDPATGRVIPGVMTGVRHIMKLHHMAESKIQGRSAGGSSGYTAEGIPAKGGETGSKRVGMLELSALISHGAYHTVRDAGIIRGQSAPDYWRQYMSGYTPPAPAVPFIYEKFINQLKSAGINPVKQGTRLNVMALTNKDVHELTGNRELRNAKTVDWRIDRLAPEVGGLFDEGLTGGHDGKRWSYIPLAEPLPSPVLEEPIRHLLGLTKEQYEQTIAGKRHLGPVAPTVGEPLNTGPKAIQDALKSLNLDKEINKAEAEMTSGRGSSRDEAIRKLGYLRMCKKLDQHPKDWVLDRVPVLPPMFRAVSRMGSTGKTLVSDPNYLYKDLWDANDLLKQMSKHTDDTSHERLAVYHAFKAVTGLGDPISTKSKDQDVKGIIKSLFGSSPKYGIVHRKLLGATTDLVGRAAIAPNPDLDMDQVGIPEDKAWTIFHPFIVRHLVRRGMPGLQAKKAVEERSEPAKKALLTEMQTRPVIITRAPVLHRYGVMAFWPQITKNDVMEISPIVTKGFCADFDGDEQIDRVFCYLQTSKLAAIMQTVEITEQFVKEHEVTARFRETLPVADADGIVMLVHLEDFPHCKEKMQTTRGRCGSVDWYAVPDGIRILAQSPETGELSWQQTTVWSEHHGCAVEIVELQSGRQIFADDDPRAVFGIPGGTLALSRTTPTNALAMHYLVPRVAKMQVPELQLLTELHTEATTRGNQLKSSISLDADFGYLVGVVAGDGWVSGVKNETVDRVCVAGISDELQSKVAHIVSGLFPKTGPAGGTVISKLSYGESRRVTYGSVTLAQLIEPMVGHGARNKHLPGWFLAAPEECRLGLFAGLMDTDGSICVSNAKGKKPQLMSNFTSTSLRLAQETQWLAASLGIRGRITAMKTPAGLPCWILSFSNGDIARWGAKYMVHADKLKAINSIVVEDTPAAVRHDLVPISSDLAAWLCSCMQTPKDHKKWPAGQSPVYTALSNGKRCGYVTRQSAQRVCNFIDIEKAKQHHDWAFWQSIVANTDVTWEPIKSVEKTDIVETGYDLTVPGYETFANGDGVILSNTMQFHVPVDPDAVDEAKEKMMPSKNLLSVKNFDVHYLPQMEYLGGLWHASQAADRKKPTRVFHTKRDAIAAYKRGEISPSQRVEIVGQ